MKIQYPALFIILIIIISACQPQSAIPKASKPNNKVSIKSKNTINYGSNNHNKIIFEGNDNEILFEYLNSIFNVPNSRDIIIVRGDKNMIKLTYEGAIINKTNSCDTIIFDGSENEIELIQKYFVNHSANSKSTFSDNKSKIKFEYMGAVFIDNYTQIENKLTNNWIPTNQLFNYYLEQTILGNDSAAFYLAELYHMGVGTKMDLKKAEAYYLIAAKMGHAEAQSSLGYLYENDDYEEIKQDIDKALFWYRKAAANSNPYAKERLSILNE